MATAPTRGEAPARAALRLGLSAEAASASLPAAAMDEGGSDLALRCLGEVEALAEEVLAGRQQIVDLDQKRNQNREALRALSKELARSDNVMVCFGNMFVQLPKTKTKDMLQRDQELLDEEITRLRKELKVKVNRLLEAQGKPELKGYSLKPLSSEEMWFIKKVLDG
ncbi:p53 and DNA damage-regulated protein 1 [Eublepharis macularius]|uniref:p53 and DNA damage-regulated protein 1 n=1 Tax=Eublepharis macularius TaxID=481883 RepID=A0AA97KXW5_EUBMA|nr:p53 and DNA damage-regulated protein 1 [Eublepharis macularius]